MKNLTDFSVTSRPLRVGRFFDPGSLFSGGVSGGVYSAAKPSGVFADQEGQVPAGIGQSVARVDEIGPNLQHVIQPSSALRSLLGRAPVTGRRNFLVRTEELANSGWLKLGGAEVQSGNRVVASGLTAEPRVGQINSNFQYVAGQSLTLSAEVTPQEVGQFSLRFRRQNEAGLSGFSTFEPIIAIGQPAPADHTITDLGGGRYRISRTITPNADETGANFGISLRADDGSVPAGNGAIIEKVQLELGPQPTPYQRVGNALDVTEAGFPAPSYLRFDLSDDVMPTTFPDGGVFDVMVFGRQGSWIEQDVNIAAGGALHIGPRSFTGAPQDVLAALGDIVGWAAIGRSLTEGEVARLLRYFRGYGAKGLLLPGPELGDPALLDKRSGTDGTVTRSGGILTFASASVGLSTSVSQNISGLTIGATYRFRGRFRRVSGSAGILAEVRTASGGGGSHVVQLAFSSAESADWNSFELLFVADATSRFVTYNAGLGQTIEIEDAAHSIRKLEAD